MTSMVWHDPRLTAEPCWSCGAGAGDICHRPGVPWPQVIHEPVPHAKRIQALVAKGHLTTDEVGDFPYTEYLTALENGEPDAPQP